MAEEENKLPHLDENILLDILLRLPVKYLLRLKVVCKHWCALISSDYFIQRHLTRATHLSNFGSWRFAMLGTYSFNDPPISYSNFLHVFDRNGIRLGYAHTRHPYPEIVLLLMGSCNGLLLIFSAFAYINNLFLFNPSMKNRHQRIQLPPGFTTFSYALVSGLGYDDNQYKAMIGVSPMVIPIDFDVCMEIFLYCTKANSWKKIKENMREYIPPVFRGKEELFQTTTAVSLKGALHWISQDILDLREYIGVLDLRSEELKKMKLPAEKAYRQFDSAMDSLNGCLCIRGYGYGYGDKTKIWVMKEYGVAESWSKLYSIYDGDNCRRLMPLYFRLQEFNEERMLEMISADTEDEDVKKTMNAYKMFAACPCGNSSATYVESLVDPRKVLEQTSATSSG